LVDTFFLLGIFKELILGFVGFLKIAFLYLSLGNCIFFFSVHFGLVCSFSVLQGVMLSFWFRIF
jgi:VanZ family protein